MDFIFKFFGILFVAFIVISLIVGACSLVIIAVQVVS